MSEEDPFKLLSSQIEKMIGNVTEQSEQILKEALNASKSDGRGRLIWVLPPKLVPGENGNITIEQSIRIGETDLFKGVRVLYAWEDLILPEKVLARCSSHGAYHEKEAIMEKDHA